MAQDDSTSVSGSSRNSYRSNWKVGNFVLAGLFVAVAVALVYQGIIYINDGIGAMVPYLMIVLGPSLAVFYVWFLLFRRPDEGTD
jgi:hypothetical protein